MASPTMDSPTLKAILPKQINQRLRAGAFVVIVQEADEAYALAAAETVAKTLKPVQVLPCSDDGCMTALQDHPEGEGTLILSDFLSAYGENPLAVRMVREVALQQRAAGERESRLILLEHPRTKIPELLQGDVEVVQPPLPNQDALLEELNLFLDASRVELPGGDDQAYQVAGAVAGLARHEAARLYCRSYVETRKLKPGWLRREKARVVADRLAGALSFERADASDVGGLDQLRSWLTSRRAAFNSGRAREFGLPEPKGLLLLGAPGAGKSLTARTVAREWELPLLRLDAGRLFGSLVGSSEAKTRAAIEAAEACAPCVLWIDEVEKAFAGATGGSTDSGTSSRVFGAILTWLQEKTSPVFVVATANRIEALPPELLRKGRFDEIFYCGLPSAVEREEILRIHLVRRGRWPLLREQDPAGQENADGALRVIAEAAEGFSGAELEQAVVSGLFAAYDADRELVLDDVAAEIEQTQPLSVTMREELQSMRDWAKGRARYASSGAETRTKRKRRRGSNGAKPTGRPRRPGLRDMGGA